MEASLPSSHNSPGPPDIASHGATRDEDSQESTTLQNALAPLPDTQNDSPGQDLSSPLERDSTLQLLSRPRNLDIDPGEGFSWGTPMKITPGQFSRPAPAKSMVNFIKDKTVTVSPGVIGSLSIEAPNPIVSDSVKKSISVSSAQSVHAVSPKPRHSVVQEPSLPALPSVKSSLDVGKTHQPVENDAEHLTRVRSATRRPPFDDYRPQYRRLDVSHQVSVPHTPIHQPNGPRDLGVVERPFDSPHPVQGETIGQGTDFSDQGQEEYNPVNHQLQQRDQPPNGVQTHEPRQRISLPNDTSVSPAQVAQHLPQEGLRQQPPREELAQRNRSGGPPRSTLNRPMRDVRRVSDTKTPPHRPSSRSSVRGSNISKKRSQARPRVPSRTRTSRQHSSRYYDDTPSIRRRDSHPLLSNRSLSLENSQQSDGPHEIDMFAGHLAQSLNSYLEPMKQEWRRQKQQVAHLNHLLRKQDGDLSKFKRHSEGKSDEIQKLKDDRGRLQDELGTVAQQLEDRSAKLTKFEEKYRTCKEYLNSAIAEQQGLYTAAKEKCENAIQQMRQEERKRKAVDEQERKELAATRERLTQIVKSTVAECSFKERDFNNKIDSLNQRIQERDADIERERETIRSLVEQNATVASVQGAVKSFESQIAQIAKNVEDVVSGQAGRDQNAAEETRVKLDKIVEHLSALEERIEPQASIIEKMQEVNMRTFSTAIKPVLNSHTEIQANIQKLADAVEDYMEDFWMKLEDREDVLTELLDQTKADNAQLQADLQVREEECNGLFDRLEQAGAKIQQRETDLENLKSEIAELEQAQADNLDQTARVDSLHEECEKLKVDVAAKVTIARDLESRLQQSQEAFLKETEQHRNHTQELHRLMAESEEAARATQEAAVEVARQEVTHDMDVAREKISTLLKQAEADITSLKDELNAAKHQLSTAEETNRRESTTVNELRSELDTARAKVARLDEEADENQMANQNALQKAFEHNSARIEDLQAKVVHKEKQISQLSEDAQVYDRQAQKVLDSLKTWAQDHHAVKGFASELEKAQRGDLDGIDPKLKPFFKIDVLHKAIFQYCQTQGKSAQDEEPSSAEEPAAAKDIWADLPPSSPPEQIPPKSLAARVLDQVRRVTVKSPSQSAASPIPPSVLAEQAHRRSANPPRSILKACNQSTSLGDGDLAELKMAAELLSLPSWGRFGRRTYRPSAAAKKARQEDTEPRVEDLQEETESTHSKSTRASSNRPVSGPDPRAESGITRLGSRVGKEPQKRKQAADPEAESPNKRTKIDVKKDNSTLSTHHSSPPECQVDQGDEPQVVPNAPRKSRKHSNVFSKSNPPALGFHFNPSASPEKRNSPVPPRNHTEAMELTSGGLKSLLASRAKSTSQDSSQDPQVLYYKRRRSSQQIEDSQDSIAHSQGVRDDLAGLPIQRRRFTMGP